MRKLIYTFLLSTLLFWQPVFGQNAKADYGTFALTNAKIVTVTNGTIENGTLVIQDGKILALGTNVNVPSGAKVFDCTGMEIYPGMIEGGSRIGLTEVGSDQRTRDYNEIGDVIPQMKALTAVNPNSALIPVNRISGVTTSLVVPAGGVYSGTAALINLHGYTPDQMYAGFESVVINYPVSGRRGWWDRRSEEEIKKAAEKAIDEMKNVWEQAKEYARIDSGLRAGNNGGKADYYPEMEALIPYVKGEKPVILNVSAAKDILSAIKWVEENNVNAIFSGVEEGWRVAEELAKAKIPVIAGPVLSNPTRSSDRYDQPYKNPGIMSNAGVKVALSAGGAENIRNLPYNAGFAAAYGMGREEALKAITINPAEIFGVSDRMGSLEEGKDATLFVTTGDPFETSTDVTYVFIEGWNIPLESRQTKLYDEFLKREPGVE